MELSYCFIWKNRFRQSSRLTRLTNNSVESWFGYFRNNFLDISRRLKFKRLLFPKESVIPYYSCLSINLSLENPRAF